ncbi:hypothetical protein FDG2_1079 [Candidatus Protofrankia californiensis]|uniref:Type I restriction modification DNA specificity domain-containing protein n=1 Tax=Candidatus Protofrankia californiensis TaxID=1839754 RepID=A0A1C3NUV3_9ACTN|nr:hypothetical protein FDG2_1079 [Candidatus Protofrankia californiensis]
MTLNLDKTPWKRVRLGDVVRRSREQVDPLAGSVERYVAGGHIDGDGLVIERWGAVDDGQMGSTFRYVFRPGQVLFVSARPYLRKVGVPQFGGVVADKTYVLNAIPENGISQRFLPFVLSSDRFVKFATAEATGSMNPRLLWGPMQRYEFDLPSIDEQKRIADLLWAVERHRLSLLEIEKQVSQARNVVIAHGLPSSVATRRLADSAAVASGVTLGPARRAMKQTTPYLRVANVQRGALDLSEVKDVGVTDKEIKSKGLKPGDILVVEGHASVDEIGRAALWDSDESPLFQNHLFRVRTNGEYRPRFLLEWINGEIGRSYIRTVAKSTSGLNTINSTVLKAMPVPEVALEDQDNLICDLQRVDMSIDTLRAELSAVSELQSSLLTEIFGYANDLQ